MASPVSRDIFGGEVQYFRLDPRYWDTVLRRFKDTGLRGVTTYVQWGTHLIGEPDKKNPAGILDFEGKTDPRLNLKKFLDLVEKHELLLSFRCGPFCCNEMAYGGYPKSLVCGDPSLMVWDYQNRATQGYWIGKKEGSQPSYLHPKYLQSVAHWFDAVDPFVVPRLRKVDSKGNTTGFITMMNLDNEISYIVKDSFLDSDYNPVNVERGGFYHQFLTEKYGSAKALSGAYGKKISAIEEVAPPREVPGVVGRDVAWYLDWVEFKQWVMCKYIVTLRNMHEERGIHNSDAFRFMTNFNPHLPEGVPTRMPAFEEAVSSKTGKGLVGYDFYRGVFMSYSGYHSMARVLKLMNASVEYTWSAEFMSGTWMKVLNGRVSDDHMKFMARCALAQGCKSISWFMFHDRDCWGDAPVSSHGHPRPSLDVLTQTPSMLFGKVKDWDALVPQTDVGIVYELTQHRHTSIGDPMPCNDNDNHVGKPAIEGTEAGKASKEYYGLFRLVEQAGVQAGVIDVDHEPKTLAKRLSKHPIVFIPGSPIVAKETSIALKKYVADGGTLVVSGPWPSVDQTGRPLAFLGLESPEPTEGKPLTVVLGKGAVVWHRDWLVQEEAEQESLASLSFVRSLINEHVATPAVRLEAESEVSYVDWQKGGGHAVYNQPRLLASAILHESPKGDERLLFVLNHYPEAARFVVTLGKPASKLIDLDTDDVITLKNNRATVDVDRKFGCVYRVE
jgi:hypothetical protein